MCGFRGCGRAPFRPAGSGVLPARSSRDGPAGTVLLSVRAAAGARGQHRDQRKWASHVRREDDAGAARAGRGSGRCTGCCAEGGAHFMGAGIFPVPTPPCRSAAGVCPSVCAGLSSQSSLFALHLWSWSCRAVHPAGYPAIWAFPFAIMAAARSPARAPITTASAGAPVALLMVRALSCALATS